MKADRGWLVGVYAVNDLEKAVRLVEELALGSSIPKPQRAFTSWQSWSKFVTTKKRNKRKKMGTHLVLDRVLHLLKEFHHFCGFFVGVFFGTLLNGSASLRAAVSPTGAFGFSKCHPQIMRCVGCDWLVQPQAQHIVSRLAILHWRNWTKEKDGKMGRQFCENSVRMFPVKTVAKTEREHNCRSLPLCMTQKGPLQVTSSYLVVSSHLLHRYKCYKMLKMSCGTDSTVQLP